MADTAPRFRAVVLAAGLSRRMQAERGPAKPLAFLEGKSLLRRTVEALRGGGIDDIRVVTGFEAWAVEEECLLLGVKSVRNLEYKAGMFSSLCAGLTGLDLEKSEADKNGAFFLMPVDAALVWRGSVRALAAAWQSLDPARRGTSVIIPTFAGRSGHPPLIGNAHIPVIMRQREDAGLRDYLASLLPEGARDNFMRGRVSGGRRLPGAGEPPFALFKAEAADPAASVYFLPLPDKGLLSDLDSPREIAEAELYLAATHERRAFLPEEAWEWLKSACLGPDKTRHSLMVGLGALRLGLALERSGREADLNLNLCAGILHDIGRASKDHTRLARQWLDAWGRPECAIVAGSHTALPEAVLRLLRIDLRDDPAAVPKDHSHFAPTDFARPGRALAHGCAAVYMADKFFQGDVPVSLSIRFAAVKERFAGDETAQRVIARREEIARAVADWFKATTGTAPMEIVARQGGHPLERLCAGFLRESGA